jgi:hypothetical protein
MANLKNGAQILMKNKNHNFESKMAEKDRFCS